MRPPIKMVLAVQHDIKRVPVERYECLPQPLADNTPDSTRAVEDLLELDLPPTMATAPSNAAIFRCSSIRFPLRANHNLLDGSDYTFFREVVCTCGFCVMLGMPCCHFWAVGGHIQTCTSLHKQTQRQLHSKIFITIEPSSTKLKFWKVQLSP